MIFEPDGQDTGRDCMRKAVILCVVFSCAAVLTACAGNGGKNRVGKSYLLYLCAGHPSAYADTYLWVPVCINTTGDAGAMPENVLLLEIGETDAPETMLPFDPKLPIQYSPDGKSALITEYNHTDQVKRLYQVNEPKGCMEETRWWKLQKETGQLEIWDALENQSIFEGPVSLDETGNLVNEKYYDRLLWEGLCQLWDYTEETSIRTWVDSNRTKDHMREYESREAFLLDAGFEDVVPMYQYYDRYHNLRLELYMDESAEQLCGLVYCYYFNSNREKCVDRYEFTIDDVGERDWEEDTVFSLKSVYGTDGADAVEDFEETVEYTEAGNPDFYKSQGLMEHRRDEDGALELAPVSVLELDYVYRDDGTLYCRDYTHNPSIFGTTLCSLESYYDERGRAVYESGYITHGQLEYFYIYGDKREKPEYLLTVDYGGGYAIPTMERYR